MMYNMKFINKSKYLKKLTKISFYYFHLINFILIIIENALLMFHYYRDYSLDYVEYNNMLVNSFPCYIDNYVEENTLKKAHLFYGKQVIIY